MLAALVYAAVPAAADPKTASNEIARDPAAVSVGAVDRRIAVVPFEALGMDPEPVSRLETLFRIELDRLAKAPLATRREVQYLLRNAPELASCGGADTCLAAIGKQLGVDAVVAGSVAGLGNSFIIDLKLVDVASGEQLRRVATEPLRNRPDALIDSVRVAAYRLLAPQELVGAIAVLTDLPGAQVLLDGETVGVTPLDGPLTRVALGQHNLRVVAAGYAPFQESVAVRFQKTSQVVVRLTAAAALQQTTANSKDSRSWYRTPLLYLGAGLAAGLLGGYLGYRLTSDTVIDCNAEPMPCR